MKAIVTEVHKTSVSTDDSWVFGIPPEHIGKVKIGDVIETFTVGGKSCELGQTITGAALNGVTLWQKTDEEVAAERAAWKEKYDREEAEAEAASRAEYAEKLAADPLAFDWDKSGPSPEAAAALDRVTDESEFPQTYSGQSWRAAYRMWKATAADPDIMDGLGPFDDVPGVDVDGLGLSGFMFGWACNAVRQMRGKLPKANPAILTIGGSNEDDITPSRGSADSMMKAAIGGGR